MTDNERLLQKPIIIDQRKEKRYGRSVHDSFHHHYINNVFGEFFNGLGDFFRKELFPRSKELVIGTYAKAVQHYTNRQTEAGEKHTPGWPFLTLDPSLDFEPEEKAGRFFYGYPSFEKKFASQTYDPKIYKDDNIEISPVLNRYKGRMELIIWCGSVYENIDYRVWAYQFFGGLDRPIYPKSIEGYFVLPDEVVFYDVVNRYTEENYTLDWTNTPVGTYLVKNINQDKYVFPFVIKPWVTLLSVSDASEKYGADELGESKLTLEMEWECALPTHLIFKVSELPDRCCDMHIDIHSGFKYKMTPEGADLVPYQISTSVADRDNEKFIRKDLIFKTEYTYQLTAEDIIDLEAERSVSIQIPEQIKKYQIIVNCFSGRMMEDYEYKLVECLEDSNNIQGSIIEIYGFAVRNFVEGDIISFAIYKEEEI